MKIKHSKELDNYIMFLTGLPEPLAQKVESIDMFQDGKFKIKMRVKINTKGWVMVRGTFK